MVLLLLIIFFVLGLIIGSFLNVVVYRLNTARSLGGRSACMSCKSKLAWYELIPVFSFLGLQGRCKNCKTKISIQYPLVELATGLLFATLFLKFQYLLFTNIFSFSVVYIYYAVVFSLLIVIATYDLKHKIIPDALSLILGILAFVGLFIFSNSPSSILALHFPSILELLAGVLLALPFYLLWLLSHGTWMGLGDAKLAIGLGWLLGLSRALSGVTIAFWSGAIMGIFLMLVFKKYKMRSEIPFAPYLVLGAFLAFICEIHLFGYF